MPRPKGAIYEDPATKKKVVTMGPGDILKRARTAMVPRRRENQLKKLGGTFGALAGRR